ncbi:hypothetical protein CLV56_2003 [Mumia flava]|uniref:Integral membrane protein n=1 Tax=Mumia flava TaxID=1348852 RepID=A0A0B2B2S6_9ACTN|nr:hypothetical protein [Mumia flava]PJJ57765.1 hypothetical protein CLV56_2003 [Mumia flava]
MDLVTLAASLFCTVLVGLAAFQVALAAGAPLGRYAWGGSHVVLPTRLRVGSVVAIVIYAVFAAVVLADAGMVALGLPEPVIGVLTWVIAGYLAIGTIMNAASRSRAERVVMTPVSTLLCAASVVVALG